MKRNLKLLQIVIGMIIAYSSVAGAAEWDLSGVNKIWTKSISKRENRNSVDYSFEVPVKGEYMLGFVACPPCMEDGEYSCYEIMLDNQDLGVSESFEKGWHIYEIDYGCWMTLAKGKHTISIITPSPLIAATGELIISGSGELDDYNSDSDECPLISSRASKYNAPYIVDCLPIDSRRKYYLEMEEGDSVSIKTIFNKPHIVDIRCEYTYQSLPGQEIVANSSASNNNTNGLIVIDPTPDDVSTTLMLSTKTEREALSWSIPSYRFAADKYNDPYNLSTQYGCFRTFKAPVSGIYCFSGASLSGRAEGYMIGGAAIPNGSCPFSFIKDLYFHSDDVLNECSTMELKLEADEEYVIIGLINDTFASDNPKLMILGGDCNRPVAWSDVSSAYLRNQYDLSKNDAVIKQSFSIPTTSIKIETDLHKDGGVNKYATIVVLPADVVNSEYAPINKGSNIGSQIQNSDSNAIGTLLVGLDEIVTIEHTTVGANIYAFSLKGKCLGKTKSEKDIYQFSPKNLGIKTSGVYLLVTESNDSIELYKIIIK